MDTKAIWAEYMEVSGSWDTHWRTCEECTDGHMDDDIWRVTTDCETGWNIVQTLKAVEIVLGITPTNR